MGKSCWMTRLVQELLPIKILLPFPIFKLLSNFIFPALFISGINKVQDLKLKGG